MRCLRLRGEKNGACTFKNVIINGFEVNPESFVETEFNAERIFIRQTQLYIVRIGVMILSFLSRLTFSSLTLKVKIKATNKVNLD